MANDEKDALDKHPRLRSPSGYRAQRAARLRVPAARDRVGTTSEEEEGRPSPSSFGSTPEDGLRMLAALETMSSLEPDYVFELDERDEASITIIERAAETGETSSLQARLDGIDAALEAETEALEPAFGEVEEATVEIFELGEGLSEEDAALLRQRLLISDARGKR